MVDPNVPGAPPSLPGELVGQGESPDTVAGWKALSDGLLSNQVCAFHRNMEISGRYAWMYGLRPDCFKWVGLAAFASHHVRLALVPLRLDADRAGRVDLPRSVGRPRILLMQDVNTIRATNNAIYDDIFWVHLAYLADGNGIERLRTLLGPDRYYAPILSGFEAIDRGRRILDDSAASEEELRAAEALIWRGNVQLLEHEQRALVQPNFDRLSCAFARLVSIGSATTFEVRGGRQEAAHFTSFYLDSLTRGMPRVFQSRAWPRITRFDDRWWWIVTRVVPRFQRFADETSLFDARSLARICEAARRYASTPCLTPHFTADGESMPQAWTWRPG